eukprot:TRINITY_DN538_c3_g1_i1.p1 TRINITY_DN538_c3_g1~~TRINITY_DN538_c3_g1_i1.p1  ORF type:complete len:114 (-),score=7.09 TRINITY_DN538_c3_g1_i1:868-1209(-)
MRARRARPERGPGFDTTCVQVPAQTNTMVGRPTNASLRLKAAKACHNIRDMFIAQSQSQQMPPPPPPAHLDDPEVPADRRPEVDGQSPEEGEEGAPGGVGHWGRQVRQGPWGV